MENWSAGVSRLILDRSVEELFASLIVALVIAAAGAALGAWLCRSRKDETTRLTAVILVATLLGMVVSGGFVERQYLVKNGDYALTPPPHHALPPEAFGHGWGGMRRSPMYYRMQSVLDVDADGRVSHEELRDASKALGTERRQHVSGPPMTSEDVEGFDLVRRHSMSEGL